MLKKVLLVATVQSHICQFHRPLVEMLRESGENIEIHVAAKDNLAEKNGLALDFADKVFDVPFSRSPKSPDNIKAYQMLKQIIDTGEYDIIHCNTPVGGLVTRLAARTARRRGTKVFYTAHGFHFYKGAPLINWLLYYPIEKIFSHFTDKIITIVDEDYHFAQKHLNCPVYRIHGAGVDERRYFPVKEGEKLRLRRELGLSPCQKVILNVGELLPNKNQYMAVRMMENFVRWYPDAVLLIAGNGKEREKLEAYICSLGLQDNVRILGYVTNLQDYQNASDLLVACSIREGLGLNVIEAMLVGNPVILTDNRGHRELIDGGCNGYMVPVNDYEAMAKYARHILSDGDAYNTFSKNALSFVKRYGAEAVKKELNDIYEL